MNTFMLCDDVEIQLESVGGKILGLKQLSNAGFNVLNGIVLPIDFFSSWENELIGNAHWERLKLVTESQELEFKDVNEITTEIKESLELEFSHQQESELFGKVGLLDTDMFIVRSSAVEEDTLDNSFAGQYDSVVGVTHGELKNAIRAVYKSALNTSVIFYKKQFLKQLTLPNIAIIVQPLVETEVAGVAFSLNPLNNDFDEVLVNSVTGLGESLVSGQVNPNKFVVSKPDLTFLESEFKENIVDKEQHRNVITDVSNTTSMIEKSFGYPVDVEWGYKNKELYIFQSRAVTNYIDLKQDLRTEPGEQKYLYLDYGLADVFSNNRPLTPLSISIYKRQLSKTMCALGFSEELMESGSGGLISDSGGRIYFNISNLLHLIDTKKVAEVRSQVDVTMGKIYQNINRDVYKPSAPPTQLSRLKTLIIIPKILIELKPLMASIWSGIRNPSKFERELKESYINFEREARSIDANKDLAKYIDELSSLYGRHCLQFAFPGIYLFYWLGHKKLLKLHEDGKINGEEIQNLMSGKEDLVTEMGVMLHDLSKFPEENIEENPLFSEFINLYGFRGKSEMEYAEPRYKDDVEFIQFQCRQLKEAKINPREVLADKLLTRKKTNLDLEKKLNGRDKKRYKTAFNSLRMFEHVREIPKHYYCLISGLIRERVEALSREYLAGGVISDSSDIYMLEVDELLNAPSKISLIERKCAHNKLMSNNIRFPHAIDSRGRILNPASLDSESDDGVFQFSGVSGGKSIGKVKKLNSPDEKKIEKGDILVTYTTDPAWTPLFLNASAIILEVGGELQHGALVAREYGIPCVVGFNGAMDALLEGQEVEVDGDTGTVKIVEQA